MRKVVEYKLIEGYPDYMVSSDGKVWSLKYGKMKELSPSTDKGGYLCVCLYKDGECKTYKVHRLVLNTFVPKPSEDLEVMHMNSTPSDNRLENLSWGTRKENNNDPHTIALHINRPDMSIPVLCVETGEVYPSAHEVERQMGIFQTSVSACCNGRQKTAGGYHWRKLE